MRDDGISKLDFFKGRLHLNNMLRLRHLDRGQAFEAVLKPLLAFNEMRGEAFRVEGLPFEKLADFQPGAEEGSFVKEILDRVRVGEQFEFAEGQAKVNSAASQDGVASYEAETPYLQLVLLRLWEHPQTQSSKILGMQTLENLGGVENIVKTHLDEKFSMFSRAEQDLISKFIHFTVTRDGAKFPCDAATLAEWANIPESEKAIGDILDRLSSQDCRIFKRVEKGANKFEFAHDALAKAVLSWRTRYFERLHDSLRYNLVRWIKYLAPGVVATILALVSIFLILLWRAQKAEFTASNANQKVVELESEVKVETKDRTDNEDLLRETRQKKDELLAAILMLENGSELERTEAVNKLSELARDGAIDDDIREQVIKLVEKRSASDGLKVKLALDSVVGKRRVFIRYTSASQADEVAKIRGRAEKSFDVRETQEVNPTEAPRRSEIRYFHKEDSDSASRLLILLSSLGLKVSGKFMPRLASDELYSGKIEVWLNPATFQRPATVKATVVPHLNLRSEPSDDSKVLATIPPGEGVLMGMCEVKFVIIGGVRGKWCAAQYGGANGYLFTAFVDYVD
jgi:hypothetical protein